jgi:hypothetical protein
MSGSSLPFLDESPGCAGHDLLVLNTRPDLAQDPASAFAKASADTVA